MYRLNVTARSDQGERAYERLRELIVQGTLAPGTRLIESELAAGLGMSRTPVRSALQRLQQEGLVHATGRARSARLLVAPLTRDDGTELLHIIGALEGLAARRAASLDAAGRERHAAALLEINRALGRAALAEPADPGVVLHLHTRFHGQLLELPGMPRLRALLDAVEPQALSYGKLYSGSPREFVAEVAEEHAVIIDGIARGIPSQASARCRSTGPAPPSDSAASSNARASRGAGSAPQKPCASNLRRIRCAKLYTNRPRVPRAEEARTYRGPACPSRASGEPRPARVCSHPDGARVAGAAPHPVYPPQPEERSPAAVLFASNLVSDNEEDRMPARNPWTAASLRLVLFVVAALLAPAALPAQSTGTLRGSVTAAGNLRPLAGAQVSLPGTGRGALTNASGQFIIVGVPAGNRDVRVQMIGYNPVAKMVSVTAGQSTEVQFQLEETAIALDELVVTATGTARKKEIGNSLSAIDQKQIEIAPVQNTQDIIAGRATGVTVMMNSGAPGAGGTIRLRGNNSISQGNNPLIYVDGVRIYSGSGPAAWGSHQGTLPLNDISAEDIERVEIVKGAAATTLYGTEASGGVIQIFTKKGVVGEPIWSAEVGLGANSLGHLGPKEDPTGMFLVQCRGPDLVDSQGNAFADPTCPESGSWLQRGGIQRTSLSVRGGAEKMTYFVSGNYNSESGAIETGWSKDGGFRGNFTFSPVEKLQLSMSSAYTKRTTRWVPDGNNASGFLLNVTRGNANYFKKADECAGMNVQTCVVNGMILDQENYNRTDHFVTGFTVNYAPLENLTNRLAIGYDYNYANNETHYPFGYLRSPQGFLWTQGWKHTTLSLDYAGSLQNKLGNSITSTFSWGGQMFEDRDRYMEVDGFDFAGPGAPTLGSAAKTEAGRDDVLRVINAGLFLQEMIGIKDRLFITAGLRVDGNSAFGQDFGLQPYPKVSASYVISDHGFWPTSWWETLKLRAAVGESGKAPGAFDAVRTWRAIAGEDGKPGFTPNQLGNPQLGPERSREVEAGFESSMFAGRLGLDVTYFHQNTFDALIPVRDPPSSGFLRPQLRNVGTLENKGLEVGINGDLIRTAALDWRARLNISTVESKAVDLGGEEINIGWDNYIREGHPVPGYFGAVITNPNEVADPKIERDQYIGPSYPTRTIGMGTTLTMFERLTLDMLGEFVGGHYLANWVGYQNARRGVWRPCYDVQQRLRAARAGDASALNGVTAKQRGLCAIDRRTMNNDFWIQPADFFKLRNVSLTYELPQGVLFGSRSASVTLSGRNLLTVTEYDGMDPEVSELGQYLRRTEYYNLPPLRSIMASVRVSF